MNVLDAAVERIAAFLQERGIPYMLIGGVANVIWGQPRLTRDADITVQSSAESYQWLVGELATRFHVLPSEPVQFMRETRVLPIATKDGVRIDLVFAALDYEMKAIKRAVSVTIGQSTVKVCTAEDLVIHKVLSDRIKDQDDLRAVIRRQGKAFDRSYVDPIVRDLSRSLDRPDIWDSYASCFSSDSD